MFVAKARRSFNKAHVGIGFQYPPLIAVGDEISNRHADWYTRFAGRAARTINVRAAATKPMLREQAIGIPVGSDPRVDEHRHRVFPR